MTNPGCKHGIDRELVDCKQCESEQRSTNPVLYTHSKEQLIEHAREFIRLHCGMPRDLSDEQRHKWHEQLGLLVMFVTHVTDEWNPQ